MYLSFTTVNKTKLCILIGPFTIFNRLKNGAKAQQIEVFVIYCGW